MWYHLFPIFVIDVLANKILLFLLYYHQNPQVKFQFGELKKWNLPIKTYKLLTIKLLYSMFLINYYIGAFVWK